MKKRVLCFGDSNTWGYIAEDQDGGYILRHPSDIRWPGALQLELGDAWEVLEEGLCARTSTFDDPVAPGRNGRKALVEYLQHSAPVDVVVLALGINDLKENVCGSPEESASAYGKLLDELAAGWKALRIVVVSPAHIGAGIFDPPFADEFGRPSIIDDSKRLANLQSELAGARGIVHVPASEYAQAGPDGLHISSESHRQLAKAVAAALRKMFT